MTRQQWCEDERLASDQPVVSLLRAAAAPSEPGPQPGEQAALAAFRATASPRRFSMHSLVPVKAALAAAVTGGVLLTGGVAAAATGTLPGAAQDTARTILSHVGVSVPGADGSSAGHADQRGTSTDGTTQGTGDQQATTDQHGQGAGSQGKGAMISQLAKAQYATGHDRGVAVSAAASGGKSHAGDAHGQAGQNHGTTGQQSDHAASGQAHRPATPGDQAKAAAQDNQPTTGRDASTTATAGQHQR